MADKLPVTLIFIDEKENFKESLPQIGKDLFQDVKNFYEFSELNDYLMSSNNQLDIILFIHVFRLKGYKGHKNAIKTNIKANYPNLKIYWVTSDKPGETGEAINHRYDTFKYDDIWDLINDGTIKSKKICELKDIDNVNNAAKNTYIFISHSSNDETIITSFYENILRLGLNILKDQIFYSSHPSTGISTGEDIPDAIKTALNKMTIFIQYISNDYKASEICLNEMGAAFVKLEKNKIITLKAPNLTFNDVGFLNIQRIGLSINVKDDLLSLSRDYHSLFNFDPVDFNNKVDTFLKKNRFKH